MGIIVSSQPKIVDTTKGKDAKKPSVRDAVVIRTLPSGFSPSSLTVYSGQAICWEWDSEDIDIEHNIKQVTLRDHLPIPVPNGLCSPLFSSSGFFEATINTPGTYYFVSDGHSNVRVGTVKVVESPPELIKVSDHKFAPDFVEICEGDSVTWQWETIKGDLNKLEFCLKHCGILTTKKISIPGSDTNGSYTECFHNAGMYYFTEDFKDVCIIKVVKQLREVSIVFQDSGVEPTFINAFVGDKIWVRNGVSKQNDGVMMIKAEDGGVLVSSRHPIFKVDRQPNLLSYSFSLPGVYRVTYISGLTSLTSLVLVSPKPSDYVVNINQHGFLTELGSMKQGDRIWWVWSDEKDEKYGFLIDEMERTVLGNSTPGNTACNCKEERELLSAIGHVGVISSVADTPGLFSYQVKEIGDWKLSKTSLCSLIVQTVSKDHIVQVNDHTFHPPIVNVHPGDSVTWVWRDTMKSHNIQQVSHERIDLDDGFHSACLSRSPDAFSHVFTDLGVFYFISSNLSAACGAVVVTAGNQVHKVEIYTLHGVDPDPVGVRVGDLVCWRWNSDQRYSINSIQSSEEFESIVKSQSVPPARRCLAQTFSRPGMHHVVATAYLQDDDDQTNFQPCDSFINTIFVDPAPYACRMKLSRDGFTPQMVVLAKHDSILWYWDDPEEMHNIVLVENPKGRSRPLTAHGPSFFESGPVIRCSSFFHTFDVPGSYWVTSQGTEGKTCHIDVLKEAKRLLAPVIVGGNNGGNVELGYIVYLSCDDDNVQILYTLDGTQPCQQNSNSKVYNPQTGIALPQPGLYLVRALSTKEGWINSRIFTSRRFWVFCEDENEFEPVEDDKQVELRQQIVNWQWFSCVPTISFFFLNDNVIHIDIILSKIADHSIISGFQLYINGIPYGCLQSAHCPGVLVSGLAGYRVYHMVIVVFPNMEHFHPQLSNQIVVNCPPLASAGGPLISLESCNRVDAVVIVWAANHSCQYVVLINGQPMGEQFYPEPNITYCQVLFEMEHDPSQDEQTFIICVEMKQEDNQSLFSNKIQLCLPLPEGLIHARQPMTQQRQSAVNSSESVSDEKELKASSHEVTEHESKGGVAESIVAEEGGASAMNQTSPVTSDKRQEQGVFLCEPAELIIVSQISCDSSKDPALNSEVSLHQSTLKTIHEDKELDIVFTRIDESIHEQELMQEDKQMDGEEHEGISKTQGAIDEEVNVSDKSSDNPDGDTCENDGEDSNTGDEINTDSDKDINADGKSNDYDEEVHTGEEHDKIDIVGQKTDVADGKVDKADGEPFDNACELNEAGEDYVDKVEKHGSLDTDVNISGEEGNSSGVCCNDDFVKLDKAVEHSGLGEEHDDIGGESLYVNTMNIDGTLVSNGHVNVEIITTAQKEQQLCQEEKVEFGGQEATNVNKNEIENCKSLSEDNFSHNDIIEEAVTEKPDELCINKDEGVKTLSEKKKIAERGLSVDEGQKDQSAIGTPDEDLVSLTNNKENAPKSLGKELDMSSKYDDEIHVREEKDNLVVNCQVTSDLNLAIKGASSEMVVIEWEDSTGINPSEYSVMVWGEKFSSSIDSNKRFDFRTSPTPEVWPSEKTSLQQHVWLTDQTVIEIHGLKPRQQYSLAVFVSSHPEMYLRSDVAMVTIPGRPKAPVIRVLSLKDREFTICWKTPCCYGDAKITGYKLLINGSQHEDMLPHDSLQHTIVNLEHGTITHVSLVAVTCHPVGDSAPSNKLTISCPEAPPPQEIAQCLSPRPNTVSISWTPVTLTTDANQSRLLSSYSVFVDDIIHGSCPASDATDVFQENITYVIPECTEGRKYSVYVRGHVDPHTIDSSPPVHVCGCYGEMSNILQVSCTKYPVLSGLVVKGMDENKVELSWNEPPNDTLLGVKGYVLRVDGHIHGDLLDPDTTSTTLANLWRGNDVVLSLTPVFDQPRLEQLQANIHRPIDGQDSGVESSSSLSVDRRIAQRDLDTSPSLTLHLWGLVRKVHDVRITNITCCSVQVRWNLLECNATLEERPLFVHPEGYTIKVFESGELDEQETATLDTDRMDVDLTNLTPSSRYAVIVEAYARHPNDTEKTSKWNVSKSEKVRFDTTSAPLPPENIKVVSCTLNSVCLSWDPLNTDNSSKFIHLKVHKIDDIDNSTSKDAILNFVINSHMTSYTIHSLEPKTQYLFNFKTSYSPIDQQQHICSTSSSIKSWTSGLDRPRDVHVTKRSPFSIHVAWQPAVTYGDLGLLHYRVHYFEKKGRGHKGTSGERTLDVPLGTTLDPRCELKDLEPGVIYNIAIEALVFNNESSHQSKETEENEDDEIASSIGSSESDWVSLIASDCLSKSITVSTLAPPGKPEILVSRISATQVHLSWNRPAALQLETGDLLKAQDQELSGRIRQICGYTLEVNGRVVTRLPSSKHSFTLKRCKPGMKYTCYLIAMTTMADTGRKENRNGGSTKKAAKYNNELTDSEDEINSNGVHEARSDALEITIPRQDSPLVVSVHYNPSSSNASSNSSADSDEPDEGCVIIEWRSSTPLKGVTCYRVRWSGTLDNKSEEETALKSSCSSYQIYPVKQRSLYTVWLNMTRKDGSVVSYGPLQCQVPGRPDSPWLWYRSISSYRIHLEWNEPRTYGIDTIRAYHVNLNGRQLGKQLSPQTRKAVVHCQPNSVYRIMLMVLTTDPHLGEAVSSNLITVCTPGVEGKGLDPKQNIRLKPLWAENDSLTVEWSDDNDLLTVDHYVIKWSSVLQPQPCEKVISVEETSYCIEDCQAGTRHFIAVAAIDGQGKLLSKSPQLIMQTSAPLQAPQLRLYSALPSSMIVQWEKPHSIGDATVDAYEIKVNGEVVAMLDSDDLSFDWRNCSPCKEYSFKIKTVSSKENCHSDWSQVLPVVCPGACQPLISRAPSSYVNSIHVTWDTPALYGGATVECYLVHFLAKEEEIPLESILGNPDVITHGPLESTTHDDILTNALPSLPYWVILEAHILPEGCHRVFSRPIRTRVAIPPDPPGVVVNVIGLKERKTLERFACRLALLKDRICRKLQILQNTVIVKGSKQKEVQIAKNRSTLRNLDIELTNCVQYIKTHTGTLNAEVSWSLPRDDGDATISGYQVFINDRKHGQPLDVNGFKINIKLSASPLDHVITLRSLTSHPVGHSAPSSQIKLLTKDFLPFVQFCYFDVHSESRGCCYEESLLYEIDKKQITTHRGSLGTPLPSPVCYVTDVLNSCTQLLISPTNKPRVILFWTSWCQSSSKAMEMFVEFSRSHEELMNFTTCCVQSSQPVSSHYQYLNAQLTSRDWLTDNVQHLCGCHPAGQQPFLRHNEAGVNRNNVSHVFGLVGVPTIVLCNQEGYVTWQGRICAHDFTEYEKVLLHSLNDSLNRECSIDDCDQCLLDHELDTTGLTSHSLSDPHDYYDYKSAKQDPSLVVTGRLSRSKEITKRDSSLVVTGQLSRLKDSKFHGDDHVRDNLLKSTNKLESDFNKTLPPATAKSTEFLRRRLHYSRPQTTPSTVGDDIRFPPKPRAKTASQPRNSIFKNRFSSSLTSSLPSLELGNERTDCKRVKPTATKTKRVKISVEEFSPV